ncbi:MAG: Hsp20 family protein [Rhodospirillales bacterium]|nr:Hsp20 family protein [Rhodospirillales bacterium]
MNHFDFSPLFRSTIGFDRLSRLIDESMRGADQVGYPPYNIEKTGENDYRIAMAVAGFAADEITLVQQESTLVVAGQKKDGDAGTGTYLHRGIAQRSFERRFQLADFIRVASARLDNGLLFVDLVREVPEAMKPRRIAIEAGTKPNVLEAKAA